MMRQALRVALSLLAWAWLAGCRTAEPQQVVPEEPTPLELAEQLYDQGDYTEALVLCLELGRRNPIMPGLPELQDRIMTMLIEARAEATALRAAHTYDRSGNDVMHNKALPETYGLRRDVTGESGTLRREPSAMEEVLQRTVTIISTNAPLSAFIEAVGRDAGVNIIADGELANSPKTMSIHVEDTPLAEILDYVSRHLNVSFHAGRNIIWATARSDQDEGPPVETRIYRLRTGDPSVEVAPVDATGNAPDITIEPHEELLDIIARFVPQIVDKSDLHFSQNAHVLIARNTRENLTKMEEILDAMDITPPQVLIEARFIKVQVDDLRELGIDWSLDSPLTVTKDGDETKTQVEEGNVVPFTTRYPDQSATLSLTYQGVLTDPMFQAVLHALEVSGKARALSVPRITTVNNHHAKIHVGENFLYFDRFKTMEFSERREREAEDDIVLTRDIMIPDGDPKEVSLGITLSVMPSVGADRRTITMALNPHIKDFVRYETWNVAGTGADTNMLEVLKLPIFDERDIQTKVVVQSGETVVMGGIISSREQDYERRVPILSYIPIIGRFFRHDGVEKIDENLLIFVTATILSERGESLIPLVVAPEPEEEEPPPGEFPGPAPAEGG